MTNLKKPRSVLLHALITGLFAVVMGGCGDTETDSPGSPGSPGDPAQAESTVESASAVINPNLAGRDDLGMLPGMTSELANAVLDARPFMDMIGLDGLVTGHLGGDESAALYAQMFVPLNLNTASDAEILLVPGVGDRMLHEFKEYRPYLSIAQWRREMGKYVDDEEVARMEQYVFVPIDLNTATDEEILAVPGVGERMAHEFREYRPYTSMEQFRREIGKYVDDGEVNRLARYVEIRSQDP